MTSSKESFDYGFPYQPYHIQRLLVEKIQDAIQHGKVGIFASPTGTGKSLSVICAVFDWLLRQRTHNEQILMDQLKECEQRILQYQEDSGKDWIAVYGKRLIEQRKLEELRIQLQKVECYQQVEKRLEQIRKGLERSIAATAAKRRKFENRTGANDSIVSEEKTSESELEDEQKLIIADDLKPVDSKETESDTEESKPQTDMQVPHSPKIIYCSRTHSQLSQFIRELQKTIYHDKVRVVTLGSRQNLCVHPDVRALGSSTLINDRCMELNNGKGDPGRSIENENSKFESISKRCPYYRATQMDALAEKLLALPMDIEEAHMEGEKNRCCAYYAEKRAIPQADILVVPYNVLLSEKTRKSFGINLENSIIIVDEAHNLSDTISSAYSVEVSDRSLTVCRDQLMAYVARYNQRLSPRNLLHLRQLILLMEAFVKASQSSKNELVNNLDNLSGSNLSKRSDESSQENSKGTIHVYSPIAFLIDCGVDNFNLFKLLEFCEMSQLARKLFGFSVMASKLKKSTGDTVRESEPNKTGTSAFLSRIMQEKTKKGAKRSKAKNATKSTVSVLESNSEQATSSFTKPLIPIDNLEEQQLQQMPSSPLFQVLELLKALTNPSEDGRVLVNQANKNGSIKYLHLDTAARFAPIAQQSHALLLLGGTMEPVDEFVDLLKPYNSGQKQYKSIEFFDCDHIIPSQNLLAVSVDQGPTNQPMTFKYETRSNEAMLRDAGLLLVNLCNLVRGGIVVFFTSYSFEKDMYTFWKKEQIIQRIENRGKRVFREPRAASDVQKVLLEYSMAVKKSATVGAGIQTLNNAMPAQTSSGAVLLSVIGGKMSEGINFNDELGRCVVVFGLPYPNLNSAELKEKFAYVDSRPLKIGPSNVSTQEASSNLYQNLCMKAVNQSIGRAIRHKNDYATIWLVDSRYGSNPKVSQRLPGWIRKSFQPSLTFSQAFRKTSEFFRSRQSNA